MSRVKDYAKRGRGRRSRHMLSCDRHKTVQCHRRIMKSSMKVTYIKQQGSRRRRSNSRSEHLRPQNVQHLFSRATMCYCCILFVLHFICYSLANFVWPILVGLTMSPSLNCLNLSLCSGTSTSGLLRAHGIGDAKGDFGHVDARSRSI